MAEQEVFKYSLRGRTVPVQSRPQMARHHPSVEPSHHDFSDCTEDVGRKDPDQSEDVSRAAPADGASGGDDSFNTSRNNEMLTPKLEHNLGCDESGLPVEDEVSVFWGVSKTGGWICCPAWESVLKYSLCPTCNFVFLMKVLYFC